MSTLKADTIQSTSGGAATLTKQHAAKAWSNIDGSGTVSYRDSFNTSGLTDNGTGDYTTSFSTSFGNANYSFTYCGASDGAETTYQMKSSSMAAGTHQVQLKNAAGTVTDRDFICGTFHGDRA